MSAVVAILIRLAGLAGVSLSPFAAGMVVALLLVGGAGVFTWRVYEAGAQSEALKCDAAALRSELEAMRRDRDAAREAERDARGREELVKAATDSDKEETANYVQRLRDQAAVAGAAGGACDLTDDDLRGLRAPGRAGRGGPRAPAGGVKPAAPGRRPAGS